MTANTGDLAQCPSPDALKTLASANTGLHDFGDPARDEGLEALMRSIDEETWADMTDKARGRPPTTWSIISKFA